MKAAKIIALNVVQILEGNRKGQNEGSGKPSSVFSLRKRQDAEEEGRLTPPLSLNALFWQSMQKDKQ